MIGDPLDLPAGTDLGGATILRLLGEGGMGRVYEARQSAPDRLVAVKVLRDPIASREQLRRFEYEAEVLGRLRHPAIAQIHTSGAYRHGPLVVPFFIMELVVDARPITHYARDGRLGLEARVALFHRVCEAVAHGHQKGVIHRDLKPANILVDAVGDPKVIDFGVARSTAADLAPRSLRTAAGQLVGTLLYMSPEQLDGRSDEIDARTDVYALGLVLHELVADRLPHDIEGTSLMAAARAAEDIGPRAAQVVERAGTAAGSGRFAARALATIVGTCLEPNPADRYATAVEVAAELARWAAGEPILARPPTWFESVCRLARRNRTAAVAAVLVLASLVAAVVGISAFSVHAVRKAAEARAELYGASVLLTAEARDRDNLPEARRRLAAAQALVADSGSRQPVELRWLAASLDDSIAVVPCDASEVLATAWSPDGTRLATASRDGTVRLVAVPGHGGNDAPPIDLAGHEAEVWRVAWSADGTKVATAAADKTARIWDAATGREVRRITGHDAKLYGVAFSRDGAVVATCGADRTARLWDAETGASVRVLAGHEGTVYSVALTGDGRTAVTASQDGTVRFWDTASGEVQRSLEGHRDWVFQAVLSPDETRLATAGRDGTARLWKIATGRAQATLEHPFRVNSVAFTADGRHVVTASHDGMLRLFSASSGKEMRRLRGHDAALWSVSCPSDGNRVATGSADRSVRLWMADGSCDPVVEAAAAVRAVAFSPDGGMLAVGCADATVGLWDSSTLLPRGRLKAATGMINDLGFLDGGMRLAAACDDGTVRVWDVDGRRPELRIPCHGRRVYSVAFTADGSRMATASDDRTVSIRDMARQDVAIHSLRHAGRVFCARYSPDGRWLYTACEDRRARSWDAATGQLRAEFVAHDGAVNWVAVSPDGSRIATASSDGTVGFWSSADAVLLRRLDGPARQIWKGAFSTDGTRVAAVSADGDVHLWDVASGRPLPVLHGHADEVWAVAFAPDGRSLATGASDGIVRVQGPSSADLFRLRQAVSPSPR